MSPVKQDLAEPTAAALSPRTSMVGVHKQGALFIRHGVSVVVVTSEMVAPSLTDFSTEVNYGYMVCLLASRIAEIVNCCCYSNRRVYSTWER